MAANTVTSKTGTVTTVSSDTSFLLTQRVNNPDGVVLYLKYAIGTSTSVTVTIDVLRPTLHATDKYRMIALDATDVGSYTFVMSAAGNYRIPLELAPGETTVYANIAITATNTTAVVVADICEY